jgi:hypothetical protein
MFITPKNVSRFLLACLCALLLSFTAFIVLLMGGSALSLLGYETGTIACIAFVTYALFLVWHVNKVRRKACNGAALKAEIAARSVFLITVTALVYVAMLDNINSRINEYYKCENTAQKFKERLFNVQVCKAEIYEDGHTQAVRISVFDEKDHLRAMRNFVFRRPTLKSEAIEYKSDRIVYVGFRNLELSISMPPTIWDRLRARIPFSDLDQFDQFWYSQ